MPRLALPLAALLVVAAAAGTGCERHRSGEVASERADDDSATAVVSKDSLHFSHLTPFLPDDLLDFRGEGLTASTSKFGAVAVSQAERRYLTKSQTARVRIVDTNLNGHAAEALPQEPVEDDEKAGHRLLVNGAVGYVEFDKARSVAHANLLVGDRVVVGVTCENARGTEEAERLSAALDLKGLDAAIRRGRR